VNIDLKQLLLHLLGTETEFRLKLRVKEALDRLHLLDNYEGGETSKRETTCRSSKKSRESWGASPCFASRHSWDDWRDGGGIGLHPGGDGASKGPEAVGDSIAADDLRLCRIP